MAVKKRTRIILRISLAAYALILAVVAIFVLHSLWGILVHYEDGTTSSAINVFFDTVRKGDFETVYQQSGFYTDARNTKQQYLDAIGQLFGDGDLSLLRAAQTTAPTNETQTETTTVPPAVLVGPPSATAAAEGERYFNMYLGDERIGKLRLVPDADGHGWLVQLLMPTVEFTVTASSEMTVLINGKPVSEMAPQIEDVSETFFTGFLKENDPNRPTVCKYTVSGLLPGSTVTAVAGDVQGEVQLKDAEKREYMVYYPMSETEKAFAKEMVIDLGHKYMLFVYKEVSKKTYMSYMYKHTVFRDGINGFINWMYGAQRDQWFEKDEVYELYKITSRDFFGSIRYQFMLTFGNKIRNQPADNTLTFVYIDDKWLLTHQQNHPVDAPGEIIKK